MSAQHTPGPWSYEISGDGYPIKGAIKGHPVRIATVHGMKAHDARLIAAAPDLLALARQYASECGECNGSGIARDVETNMGGPCPDCSDIRAVIAKAAGP